MTKRTYYIAWGYKSGACGHEHRTAGAAERCAERDRRRHGKGMSGFYSDRVVTRMLQTSTLLRPLPLPLTEADVREIRRAREARS